MCEQMIHLPPEVKPISKFEPFLLDILGVEISDQHARILAMMFKSGGFLDLKRLTDLLGIAQPTVSDRVSELVHKGFLRKNSELMPNILVLLLGIDDLQEKISQRIDKLRHATSFLSSVSQLQNKELVKDTLLRALNVFHPSLELWDPLPYLVLHTYLNPFQSRNQLYQLVVSQISEPKKILREKQLLENLAEYTEKGELKPEYGISIIELGAYAKKLNIPNFPNVKLDRIDRVIEKRLKYLKNMTFKELDQQIFSHPDIFHVLYGKHQKREMFIRPKLPLKLYTKSRSTYLDSLYLYYQDLLSELASQMTGEYETFIPFLELRYLSDVKSRISSCLKHYDTVKIIDNSIYPERDVETGLLHLIAENTSFRNNHQVKVLSKDKIRIPKEMDKNQIEILVDKNQELPYDYQTRDFIIFGEHGSIVFPAESARYPYYNISPKFVTTTLKVFMINWR